MRICIKKTTKKCLIEDAHRMIKEFIVNKEKSPELVFCENRYFKCK